MPSLHKSGRRWVTSHSRRVSINYATLDEVISRLQAARGQFSSDVVSVYIEGSQLVVHGSRYATPAEVRVHTNQAQEAKRKALEQKRDRINDALKVLKDEAPGLIGSNVTVDDVLEETAV